MPPVSVASKKRTRYSPLLRIAELAVLLILIPALFTAVCAADSLSPEQNTETVVEADTWENLTKAVEEWKDTETQRTIILTSSVITRPQNNVRVFNVSGNVSIVPASTFENVTIDSNKTGQLFKVLSPGLLTLGGNKSTALILTGGNYSVDGGCLNVKKGAVLILNQGVNVTGNIAKHAGGGVINSGTVYINGANITNNTCAKHGGGIALYEGGKLYMTSGNIGGNHALNAAGGVGGGVYLYPGAYMKMSGGRISENTAETGAGIRSSGTLELSKNSCIVNNTAYSSTGGILSSGECFIDNQVIISENKAPLAAAIYNSGELTVRGGSIKNNTAKDAGGGIYNSITGRFILCGGEIADCSAPVGAGVFNSGDITVSGTGIIAENNELYLNSNRMIRLGEEGFEAGKFGVFNISTESPAAGKRIVNGSANPDKLSVDNFRFAKSGLTLLKYGDYLVLCDAAYDAEIIETETKYPTVREAFENVASGHTIRLLNNSVLIDEIGVDSAEVNSSILDLNGFTLTAAENKRLFNITSGLLKVIDNSTAKSGTLAGAGEVFGNGGCALVFNDGQFNLTAGNVTGFHVNGEGGAVYLNGSNAVFNLSGGKITWCNAANFGGGVSVSNNSTFAFSGGLISDCSAIENDNYCGGGVYLSGNATLLMSGGKICNCISDEEGGGVSAVNGSCFIMTGGEIDFCSNRNNEGGGVNVEDYAVFMMSGGSITGCSSYEGGGGVNVEDNAVFLMSGGSITGCSSHEGGGGVNVDEEGTLKVSGTAVVTKNTNSADGSVCNLCLYADDALVLEGSFSGRIGITNVGGFAPSAGARFGIAQSNAGGAENFVSDLSSALYGSLSGNRLIWKVDTKPTPVPTQRHYSSGSSSNSGAGNYNYYPRTADGKAETISFGTSKTVKSVTLPEGVTGEVTLVAKSSAAAPSGYNTYNVFEINIPTYPTGKEAVVEFVVPLNTLAKEGKTPGDVSLLHGDGANWDAATLPTTFTVDGDNAVYHSTTTAFSPFAIVYVDGAATAETPEAAAVSSASDAPVAQPTVVVAAEKKVVAVATAEPTATQAAASPATPGGVLAGLAAALGCVLMRRRE